MRTINTLEWHDGHAGVALKAVSLNNALPARLFRYALQVLLYVPYQLNRYLDSLDAAPRSHRKQYVNESRKSLHDARHQHIPSRVWQRRSALITMLEEQHEVAAAIAEAKVDVAPVCHVQSTPAKANCTSCSFNVVQVRCLPVWSSNFSDIGMIEQELDFYSQPEMINRAV